jgi:hypothetical protein
MIRQVYQKNGSRRGVDEHYLRVDQLLSEDIRKEKHGFILRVIDSGLGDINGNTIYDCMLPWRK